MIFSLSSTRASHRDSAYGSDPIGLCSDVPHVPGSPAQDLPTAPDLPMANHGHRTGEQALPCADLTSCCFGLTGGVHVTVTPELQNLILLVVLTTAVLAVQCMKSNSWTYSYTFS